MANTLSAKIRVRRRRATTGRPDEKNFKGYFLKSFIFFLNKLYFISFQNCNKIHVTHLNIHHSIVV